MTEVSFYHLTVRPLESALPRLLERTLESGCKAVVIASSNERVDMLDDLLWTYNPESWLPHGCKNNAYSSEQPIWLTMEDENPNNATFLFLVDGAESNQLVIYHRVFELFDGKDSEAVEKARIRWKQYQQKGFSVAYWKQDEVGKWKQIQ
ncbi:MAG: DNA polymerase III subunit chi [Rhodospirillaceae bacterium]|nr:DNA polymerase III subunit chi [Rhodospirillaceae bacterium]